MLFEVILDNVSYENIYLEKWESYFLKLSSFLHQNKTFIDHKYSCYFD